MDMNILWFLFIYSAYCLLKKTVRFMKHYMPLKTMLVQSHYFVILSMSYYDIYIQIACIIYSDSRFFFQMI